MPAHAEQLQHALQHQRAGQLARAEELFRQILQLDPDHADALHLLGVLALDTQRLELAHDSIARAVELKPAHAAFHLDLGHVYRALGKLSEAKACFERARQCDPKSALAYVNLGITSMELGSLDEAEEAYREALRLQPGFAIAWNNLGNVLITRGELAEARACLEESVRLEPAYAEAHNGLGSVWHRIGELTKAQACFERALACKPEYASAHFNLGLVLYSKGHLDGAQVCFQRSVKLRPQFVEAYYQLALLLKQRGQWAEAQICIEFALRLRPEFRAALGMLASLLEYRGKYLEARAALDKAIAIEPTDDLRIASALLLPVIYESQAEIDQHRLRVHDELELLAAQKLTLPDPEMLAKGAPFFLAYQGCNDRILLEALAAIYAKAAPQLEFVAPHCEPGPTAPSSRRPIRVGFLSRFFWRHTIGKLNAGFICHLSRSRFRVVLLCFPGPDDPISQMIRASADEVIVLPRRLAEARQSIADQNLDVLFYTDIGMDPLTYFLAFARLAPVQCVTWGHPCTTGISTMDYFVSSVHLEPEDASKHYTERLIKLARVNTCYAEPHLPLPARSRQDFGLPENVHLYVCTQSLYKFHPKFDSVLCGILQQDPLALVVLLSGPQAYCKELLAERFRRTMPAESSRIQFLPPQTQFEFLHLQALADVLLDTFPFGGGNTSLEAFAFGTPIVTLAGSLMRGRITYACYRQMGILDCIAANPAEYVQTALRLGKDPAWRQEIRQRILEQKHLLYDNELAVQELEQFFIQAVQRARGDLQTLREPPPS
jgi:protein O-GlcNAc transferase